MQKAGLQLKILLNIAIKYRKYPSRSTLKRIVKEYFEDFKVVKVVFIDEDRYNVILDEIEKFYDLLTKEIKDVPVGFCFNLDEAGQDQYVDARSMYLIVPKDKDITTYPVSRATKRIILLHCISTYGTSCDPMIIVPRLTIDDEIYDEVTPQTVLFRTQPKGFCTYGLFSDWFTEKFIPYLSEHRQKYNYYGKALIIMDGFKGHEKSLETIEHVLTEFNISILFIPPFQLPSTAPRLGRI